MNHSKCAVSGILHRRAWADAGFNGPCCARTLQPALKGQVLIDGKDIFYVPPEQPYKYLGIQLTLNLHWGAHVAATTQKVEEKIECIHASYASPAEGVRLLQTCVQTAIGYSFAVMSFTPRDIQPLDAQIARAVKRRLGLGHSFLLRGVLLPKDSFGVGAGSLLPSYTRTAAKALALALNDT